MPKRRMRVGGKGQAGGGEVVEGIDEDGVSVLYFASYFPPNSFGDIQITLEVERDRGMVFATPTEALARLPEAPHMYLLLSDGSAMWEVPMPGEGE